MKNAPTSRLGWHSYYAQRFNRTGNPDAAVLAFGGDA